MRIRIRLELLDDNNEPVLGRDHSVYLEELKHMRFISLPSTAAKVAERFWHAIVMMGYTEKRQ